MSHPEASPFSRADRFLHLKKRFQACGSGLLLSVVVIFILLAANFQSFRLALAVVSTVPAVICGVLLILLLTGTTLNVQSFMGAIMAIGISVANAILLVTFAENARRGGAVVTEATLEGSAGRLRAVLMTALAMIAGMIPIALGTGEASAGGPARQGRDRRTCLGNLRNAHGPARVLRHSAGESQTRIPILKSQRSRKHVL